MFAKHFVSFLVWVLFSIGFVSFSVGGYICQWVCLSVGSNVRYWVCVSVGWYVIMPCNSREGASVRLCNYTF